MHPRVAGARIALLAPLSHPLPPAGYGPWEQVAFNVADGLRRAGVDVTLFCADTSRFDGGRSAVTAAAFAEDPALDGGVFTELHIANCFAHAARFDVIHSHLDWRPLCFALASGDTPMLTTIHGFSTPQILAAYYAASERSFYVSISDADRDPGLGYVATVYNGIDPTAFALRDEPGDYLLFFGRVHEEKGTHLAIEVARAAGRPLLIAGIVHDEVYYRERVAPHVDGERVRFIGEVRGADRSRVLGHAAALLQTNTRPERFGLSMVEAMACGTPVIGTRMGSIQEVVDDGVTGFVRDGVDALADAVRALPSIDRRACRARVERLFTIDVMVRGYIDAYAHVLEHRVPPPPTRAQRAARAADWWQHPVSFTDIGTPPHSLAAGMRLIERAFERPT